MAERIAQSATKRVSFEAYLSTDHVSPATGKTIAITISKNGAAFGNPSGGAANAVEIGSGSYYVDLTTTDTGTTGPLIILGSVSGVDPVKVHFSVVDPHNGGFDGVPSATAGAIGGLPLSVDTSGRVDVLKINGTSQTARDIGASVLLSSGTGTGQVSLSAGKIAEVVLVDTLTTYTGNTPQTGDAFARIGAAGAGLTAIGDTRIANLDATVSSRTKPADTQSAVTTVTNLTNAPTAGDFTAAMKASLSAATPAVTVSDKTGFSLSPAGVQAIWDALTSALTTLGSIGKLLVSNLDAAISSRSTYTGVSQTADVGSRIPADLVMTAGKVWALDGSGNAIAPESETAAIKAKTDNLPASPAASGDIPAATDNADALLGRNLAGGANGGRTVRDALRPARNKVIISAGVVTVYAEDDTTIAWTGTLTTNPTASPITGVDPA